MSRIRWLLLVFLVFGFSGCGLPDESIAERDFKVEYPRYQILKCYAGEGNSDAVYFHFEYKNEAGKLKTMQVLYFRDLKEDVWKHKRIDGQAPSNFPIVLPGPSMTN